MVLCCWPCCCCSYSCLALQSCWKWPGFLHQWQTGCTRGRGCAGVDGCCNAVCSSSVFVINAAICACSSLSSWQIGDAAAWACSVHTSTSLSFCIQRSASVYASWKVTPSQITECCGAKTGGVICWRNGQSISSFTVPTYRLYWTVILMDLQRTMMTLATWMQWSIVFTHDGRCSSGTALSLLAAPDVNGWWK